MIERASGNESMSGAIAQAVLPQIANPGLPRRLSQHRSVLADKALEHLGIACEHGLLDAAPHSFRRSFTQHRVDSPYELRPAVDAVLACDHELCVGEHDGCRVNAAGDVQPRMNTMKTIERVTLSGANAFQQLLRLFLVLIEIRTGGKLSAGHTNLLSRTPGVRPSQAERRFVPFNCGRVGTALSADWKRPSRSIAV
jgi:hypothetical protein